MTRFRRLAQFIRLAFVAALGFDVDASSSHAQAADIRSWAFEATIVELDDPLELFSDVRLGDTVWGDFSYDVAMAPTDVDVGYAAYDHPIGFRGMHVAIDNPRTGGELRYPLPSDTWLFVESATDDSFYEESSLLMWQFAEAPLAGLWHVPFINFSGRPGDHILTDSSLPTEIELDVWPTAAVLLGADSIFNGITAQIYSLTPLSPGDFNHDGAVTRKDLSDPVRGWEARLGVDMYPSDLLTWQRGYDFGSAMAAVVPEPASAGLLLFVAPALLLRRRCDKRPPS